MAQILRLHRNENILSNRESAVAILIADLSDDQHDGEFMTMRYYYKEGDNVIIRTLLGVTAFDESNGRTHVTVFDNEKIENMITDLRDEMTQNLNDEIQARKDGDNILQTNINDVNTTLTTNLNNETQARIDADNFLSGGISANTTAIETEQEERIETDEKLAEDIEALRKTLSSNTTSVGQALADLYEQCGFDEDGKYIIVENDSILSGAQSLHTADIQLADALRQEIADRKDAISTLSSSTASSDAKLAEDIEKLKKADQFLSGEISANTVAIETLNGDVETDGSIAQTVNEAASTIMGNVSEDDAKTIEALNDKINQAITDLSTNINGVAGAAKQYTIKKQSGSTNNILEEYALLDEAQKQVGDTIKIYKDSSLSSVTLADQVLKFTYILADGSPEVVDVDVSNFLVESEFAEGLQVVDGVVSVKVAEDSESFFTVDANGVKLSGVQNAIDSAINKLGNTVSGQSASQHVSVLVKQDKGKLTSMTVTDSDIASASGLTKEIERATSAETALSERIDNLSTSLSESIDSSKLTAITINNITSLVKDNACKLDVYGKDIKISSEYSSEPYNVNPSKKFSAVTKDITLEQGIRRLDTNIATLVKEVSDNEKTTSIAMANLRTGAGLKDDGLYAALTNGPAANATSLADAISKLNAYIAQLEARIDYLEKH